MALRTLYGAALVGMASAMACATPAQAQSCYKVGAGQGPRSLYPFGTAISTLSNPARATVSEAEFNIPPDRIGFALGNFVCQSGGAVTVPDAAARRPSPGVKGRLTARQALERVLVGTGLSIVQESPNGFALGLDMATDPVFQPIEFRIPARELTDALLDFAEQSRCAEITVRFGQGETLGNWPAGSLTPRQQTKYMLEGTSLSGQRSPGVSGRLAPRQALERLIAGTTLSILEDGNGYFTLRGRGRERGRGEGLLVTLRSRDPSLCL